MIKRKRGRPAGRTEQGEAARRALYDAAIAMITSRGYEQTTMREVAAEAGVSASLLYRYFPSKRAVVVALYEELSGSYAQRAAVLRSGKWRQRVLEAIETAIATLEPHREHLRALLPVLIGTGDGDLFSDSTRGSQARVLAVFDHAVVGAVDAPSGALARALARASYLLHLAVILWWVLDKSEGQRATGGLVALLARVLTPLSLAVRMPPVRGFVLAADQLIGDALLGLNAPTDSAERTSRSPS